jgi:hypothetical protein
VGRQLRKLNKVRKISNEQKNMNNVIEIIYTGDQTNSGAGLYNNFTGKFTKGIILVHFIITVSKYLTETTKGKEDLCWSKEGDCVEHSNHVRQEAETNSDMKGPGQDPDHRDTLPVTYFLKPGPVFHSSNASQQSVQIVNPSMD